jgi:hypothetical protein
MSVTVDDELLAAETLGLDTVGQVLTHVQRPGRMVVNLLIDGREPDLAQMAAVRRSTVVGRTVYIETAVPRQMALDVLDDVHGQLEAVDAFRADAADLLGQDKVARAMEKLGLCLTAWQAARESVVKTAKLLHLDLDRLTVDDGRTAASAATILGGFTEQLRQIKQNLVDRDYVCLTDLLRYEMDGAAERWTALLDAIRAGLGA